MNSITIDNLLSEKEFLEGNAIQVRVTIKGGEPEYQKNNQLAIIHQGKQANARIVSEPILIAQEENGKVFSLIIEKS